MVRKLVIEVDCGKRLCKWCEYWDAYCRVFGTYQVDEKLRPKRSDACLRSQDESDKMTFHVSLPSLPELPDITGKVSP